MSWVWGNQVQLTGLVLDAIGDKECISIHLINGVYMVCMGIGLREMSWER